MSTVVHPGDSLSRRQRVAIIILLGTLTALGPFTIDLYLPAFPVIEAQFDVPASAVQLTLTGTTIGFALGQLVMGPWSDKVGRKLPLIVASGVHVLASIGVALAPTIELLTALRVVQGAGAAASGVVAMATVRDLFGGKPLVRMLSRLALVTGLAPVLAPLIGSWLLEIMDWRGLFIFLAGYALTVLVCVAVFLRETLPPARRIDAGHSTARQRYRAVLTDRVFLGVALIGGMSFSGMFAYLASSSFLLQQVYGLSPTEYGAMFAANSLGIVIGVQVSSRLMRRIGPQWIIAVTTIVQLLMALAIAGAGALDLGLIGILVPLFLFITATGFGFPVVQVLALARHGKEAGTAASLLGAVNFGLAGIISPIVGVLGVDTAVPMGAVMAGTACVSILSLWLVVRPRTVPPLED